MFAQRTLMAPCAAVVRKPELLVGADGAFSGVRAAMQRTDRFNYSQSYLKHGYKELTIPAKDGGGFRLEKERLHIWPRGSFMMIALPNLDGSFTCTLFAPYEGKDSFAELQTPEAVRSFFDRVFPDAVPHMPTLVEDFFANPTPSLVTIRCSPWTRGNFACLLGDAAHAIVPFFGQVCARVSFLRRANCRLTPLQGMNAAFEDCLVLSECVKEALNEHADDWIAPMFEQYNEARVDNANAIADMALENYVEMRDKTADPNFNFRKEARALLAFPFTFDDLIGARRRSHICSASSFQSAFWRATSAFRFPPFRTRRRCVLASSTTLCWTTSLPS